MSDSREYFTSLDDSNPFSAKAKEIIARELSGKTPAEEPIMLFTIGCTGAGKTYLLSTLVDECDGDPSKIRHVVHSHLQSGGFPSHQSSAPKEFGNALYVSGVRYREEIAEHFLNKQGKIKGVDYGLDSSRPEEKSALAYVNHHHKEEAKKIGQTGGQVALELILQAAAQGINCVLDSTGGGFAPPKESVTEPLINAAQRSNTQLIFLTLDVDRETAISRVTAAHERGEKPYVDPSAIDRDIARVPLAVQCLEETAKEIGFDRISIVHLGPDLRVDRGKTSSPWVSGTSREATTGVRPPPN